MCKDGEMMAKQGVPDAGPSLAQQQRDVGQEGTQVPQHRPGPHNTS